MCLWFQGEAAQNSHYKSWFEVAYRCCDSDRASAAELASIDRVSKLDLTTQAQLDLLHVVYRRHVDVINYWLQQCCLPRDMQQYPERRKTSAWNLPSRPTRTASQHSESKSESKSEETTPSCLDVAVSRQAHVVETVASDSLVITAYKHDSESELPRAALSRHRGHGDTLGQSVGFSGTAVCNIDASSKSESNVVWSWGSESGLVSN